MYGNERLMHSRFFNADFTPKYGTTAYFKQEELLKEARAQGYNEGRLFGYNEGMDDAKGDELEQGYKQCYDLFDQFLIKLVNFEVEDMSTIINDLDLEKYDVDTKNYVIIILNYFKWLKQQINNNNTKATRDKVRDLILASEKKLSLPVGTILNNFLPATVKPVTENKTNKRK